MFEGRSPESQDQNLVLTILHVPNLLESRNGWSFGGQTDWSQGPSPTSTQTISRGCDEAAKVGTDKTVKPRLWPWLELFPGKSLQNSSVVPSSLESGCVGSKLGARARRRRRRRRSREGAPRLPRSPPPSLSPGPPATESLIQGGRPNSGVQRGW